MTAHRLDLDAVDRAAQVLLLEVAVRAGVSLGLTVGAAVVEEDVEASSGVALGDVQADVRLSAEPCR